MALSFATRSRHIQGIIRVPRVNHAASTKILLHRDRVNSSSASCCGNDDTFQRRSKTHQAFMLCSHRRNLTDQIGSSGFDFRKSLSPCQQCQLHTGYNNSRNLHSFLNMQSASYPYNFQKNHSQGSSVLGDGKWVVIRNIHMSPVFLKDESKVEKTVKALKEAQQKDQKSEEESTTGLSEDVTAPTTDTDSIAVATPKKTIAQRIVAEIKHYYNGFKLLFIDVKVCARLLWLLLNGKSLNRRHRKQLVRTTADLFRLVPFLVFIVVPFMEFLLPVALKMFPAMLPSTLKEENKEQEKLRKKLKVKLEMAKFLQDTIEETAVLRKGARGENVQEFVNFIEKIRTSGQETTTEEIVKYSKLFEDEITLDNLEYGQLRALCKLLDLPPMGSSYLLRFQLHVKMRQLEADDKMIQKEGIDALSAVELQDACRSRGMRALGVPEARLKSQLEQWLELHLKEQIPTSLLLLSRTLFLPESLPAEVQLKAAISQLPEAMAEEAKVKISEVSAERVDNKMKLEATKQEEEALRLEEEEARKEEAARKAEEEAQAALGAQPVEPSIMDSAPSADKVTSATDIAMEQNIPVEEVLIDKAEELVGTTEEKKAAQEAEQEEEISSKELEELEEVLEKVADERSEKQRQQLELETLKQDVEEYQENLEDLKEVIVATGGHVEDIQESKAAKRLSKKVNRIIKQLDGVMDNVNKEKDALLEEIEVKEVRIRRSQKLKDDAGLRQQVLDQISEEKADVIGLNELLESMRRLQKLPDETRLQRIVEVLDTDQDGQIDINDALRVIELLGSENVKVTSSKMSEIIELVQKEQVIEEEEKEERQRERQGSTEPSDEENITDQINTDSLKSQEKQKQ